jgi:MFS family permease
MTRFSKTLLYTDLLMTTSLGLFLPFLAVIILHDVLDATILQVGYAIAFYAIAKAIAQLIVTRYVGEDLELKRQIKVLTIGSILITIVPIGYMFISDMKYVYVLQAVWGIGEALLAPAWFSLFNKSLTQGKEGKAWAWRETLALFVAAIAAIVGGAIAQYENYRLIFGGAALLMAASSFLLIQLYRREAEGEREVPVMAQDQGNLT